MGHLDYWTAFAASGKVEDYLQYVSHKGSKGQQAEDRVHDAENQRDYYQGTDRPGE